jgi:hypothetical protein
VPQDVQNIGQAMIPGIGRYSSRYGEDRQAHGKYEEQQYAYEEIGKSSQEHEAGDQTAVEERAALKSCLYSQSHAYECGNRQSQAGEQQRPGKSAHYDSRDLIPVVIGKAHIAVQ